MILEVTLGVALKGASADQINDSQARALDEGYTLGPYEGHFRNRYVMGVRPWRYASKFDQCAVAAKEIFGISRRRLTGPSQKIADARPRQAVMWALRRAGFSWTKIGGWLNRHRTTVLYGCEQCENIQKRDMGYRRACERLLESVRC